MAAMKEAAISIACRRLCSLSRAQEYPWFELGSMALGLEREKITTPRSNIRAVKKACDGGFIDMFQLLLIYTEEKDVKRLLTESRAGPNRLLQATARSGHALVVRLFLDMGTEVYAEDGRHGPAVPEAALEGHETAKMLLAAGANPHLRGMSHGSPLLVTMEIDRTSIFRQFLQGSMINLNRDKGVSSTILQYSALLGRLDVVQELLESVAKVNAEGGVYHTDLQVAYSKGLKNIFELLLKYGALDDGPEDGPYDVMCLTLEGEVFPKLIRVPYYRSGLLSQNEWENQPLIRVP